MQEIEKILKWWFLNLKKMFDIKKIEKNKFFHKKILSAWEILFDEWDFDWNIYIIKSWKLKVEKYFSSDKKEKKTLAILGENSIFWEGALSNNLPKEVLISALLDTEIILISSLDFPKFISENTKLWIDFLTQIIDLSNKRLLEANFLLTSQYKISKMISEEIQFSNKNLFEIIEEFEKIIKAKYIIYVEVNEVLQNFINIIYDTRNPWKMSSEIFEINDLRLELEKFKKLNLSEKNLIVELKNGNKIIWFFIIWERQNLEFSEAEKKTINSIWVLLAWFIKQKQYFQNEKNKEK